jgi:FkbM family methyltransferase
MHATMKWSGSRIKKQLFKIPIVNYIAYLKARRCAKVGYAKKAEVFAEFRQSVFTNKEDYIWLYNQLNDDHSKTTLVNLLIARLTGDYRNAYSSETQYFCESIVSVTEDDVLVDCGGFVGDTAMQFFSEHPGMGKMYWLIEPDKRNIEKAKKNLSKYTQKVQFIEKGVSESNAEAFFNNGNREASCIAANGSNSILTGRIDDIIDEQVSFIKMDVEGHEIPALSGAAKHINTGLPTLAICAYHLPNDLWEIPKRIYDLSGGKYQLYLRHHCKNRYDTVIYAKKANSI